MQVAKVLFKMHKGSTNLDRAMAESANGDDLNESNSSTVYLPDDDNPNSPIPRTPFWSPGSQDTFRSATNSPAETQNAEPYVDEQTRLQLKNATAHIEEILDNMNLTNGFEDETAAKTLGHCIKKAVVAFGYDIHGSLHQNIEQAINTPEYSNFLKDFQYISDPLTRFLARRRLGNPKMPQNSDEIKLLRNELEDVVKSMKHIVEEETYERITKSKQEHVVQRILSAYEEHVRLHVECIAEQTKGSQNKHAQIVYNLCMVANMGYSTKQENYRQYASQALKLAQTA